MPLVAPALELGLHVLEGHEGLVFAGRHAVEAEDALVVARLADVDLDVPSRIAVRALRLQTGATPGFDARQPGADVRQAHDARSGVRASVGQSSA